MAKLFGELLLNDEGTRVGGLGPISHRVIYTTDNIFEGKEKEKILFLERILKKLSIQLIYIYIYNVISKSLHRRILEFAFARL